MVALQSVASWFARTFDLLDVALATAFTLIGTGCYLLWGSGWACLVLGALLFAIILVGIPVAKPKS